jgi:hypothetical protein
VTKPITGMPTDNPDRLKPGARASFRKGFWARKKNETFNPPYKVGSPAWNIYRKGYYWAEFNPDSIGPWAFSDERGIELVFAYAINQLERVLKTKASDDAFENSKRKALIDKWKDLEKRKPWSGQMSGAKGRGRGRSRARSPRSTSTKP